MKNINLKKIVGRYFKMVNQYRELGTETKGASITQQISSLREESDVPAINCQVFGVSRYWNLFQRFQIGSHIAYQQTTLAVRGRKLYTRIFLSRKPNDLNLLVMYCFSLLNFYESISMYVHSRRKSILSTFTNKRSPA